MSSISKKLSNLSGSGTQTAVSAPPTLPIPSKSNVSLGSKGNLSVASKSSTVSSDEEGLDDTPLADSQKGVFATDADWRRREGHLLGKMKKMRQRKVQ